MKLLSLARDLRRRKARERQQLFVAEGVRAVEDLLASGATPAGLLVSPELLDTDRGKALVSQAQASGLDIQQVSPEEFASAAETDSPQGVMAIGRIPRRSLADLPDRWTGPLLVLDAVQDPGNVGTIIRTAAALGAVATVALPGTVDLWNAKVVRSGMGAHFRHSALSATWSDLDALRTRLPYTTFAADMSGESLPETRAESRLALVVGNEGAGISPEARARADRIVALPLSGGVESLNVAVATGILLYLLRS